MIKKRTNAHPTKLEDLYKAAYKLPKTKREKLVARLLSTDIKEELASRWWPKKTREKLALPIPVTIYIQDPLVAKQEPKLGLQEIYIQWESNLDDGPTSARVAVVDYNTDNNELIKPASWDRNRWCFIEPNDQPVEQKKLKSPWFHQVGVWAVVMRILKFFENSKALGRPVTWAFGGNRLIIVPHAGYGENAFYDRLSKSLQFYYCGTKKEPVYTCLSHDIVAHETGHAILDGVRPYYNECSSLQTAAFHEFIADLTAILIAFRNNDLRHVFAEITEGDLRKAKSLANIAKQFSKHVENREYLRSALNSNNMKDAIKSRSPHDCSQTLTGAMFDIMTRMAANYIHIRGKTPKEAFWHTVDRFIRVALQPLDFCPPVDIQFEDYAHAVLHHDQLSNPMDPYGYRQTMREVFKERKIIPHPKDDDIAECESKYSKFYLNNIDSLSSSRTATYHFVNENREKLRIPDHQDIIVVDPYTAYKVRRANRKLPPEIVLQYIWREDFELKGSQFGQLEGEIVSLLCGGTLVYDNRGNLLYWCRKPGTQFQTSKKGKKAKKGEIEERKEGEKRSEQLLDYIANHVKREMTSLADEGEAEGLDIWTPIVGRRVHGTLRLETTPHLRHWGDEKGEQR